MGNIEVESEFDPFKVERSNDMNCGLGAKGVPKGSQNYNGSWHGNILWRAYYAKQILAKH